MNDCANNLYWTDEFNTIFDNGIQIYQPQALESFTATYCYSTPCDIPGRTMKLRTAGVLTAALVAGGTAAGLAATHNSTPSPVAEQRKLAKLQAAPRMRITIPWSNNDGWVVSQAITGTGMTLEQLRTDEGPFPIYSAPSGGKVIAHYYRDGRFVQPLTGSQSYPPPSVTTVP